MSQANQQATTPPERVVHAPSIWSHIFRTREIGVLAALIVLCMVMSFASPYFMKTQNLFNVLRGMSTIGIMAIGMTMVIVSGGIDLSVGSLAAVSAMLTARLMTYHNVPPWISFVCGMLMGLLLGTVNGTIITRLKVNPFITTLGMMSVARGLTYLISTGLEGGVASNIPMRNEQVNFLGSGYIGVVPFPVIEMAVLVTIFSLFLQHVVLGRQIYAVGSNEQAARLSGVNVANVRLFVYMLLGGLAALAGVMGAGLLSTAPTNLGLGNELDVIAAVVIGGASLAGGEGTILGAVIGAAIMAVIRNAFVLLKLPIYLQTIAIGVVIIIAVALDQLRKRRS
ncbi:MAG: ABC transporter permease [Anaerolineales bacterium]|jgi:ribose transport system permease protein|nr:ABC transporter permease [Anaerolineales bacterium]